MRIGINVLGQGGAHMHAGELCHKWLSNVLPEFHSKRLDALCAAVCSAIRGGRLSVTSLGRSLNLLGKAKHNIKRADRLLSNARLHSDRRKVYHQVAHEVIGTNLHPVILVDWSDVDPRGKFFLLRAALAVNGRSLTVYEEVHELRTKEKRKTHRQFLRNLKEVLPAGCTPIIVTDAGFRIPWFVQVLALGWDYVGRVRGETTVQITPNSEFIRVKSLYSQATRRAMLFPSVLFSLTHKFPCAFVLFKAKPKGRKRRGKMGRIARGRKSLRSAARGREPWLLATSLDAQPHEVVKIYSTRMQIEESFRDLKCARLGLSLHHNRTYKIERMRTLILIGSLANIFTWILGKAIRSQNKHKQFQANTHFAQPVLSNVFIGVEAFRNANIKIPWRVFKLILPRQYNALSI